MRTDRYAARIAVVCIATLIVAARIGRCDEMSHLEKRVAMLENKSGPSSLAGVSFSGYLDASYTNNLNNPPNRLNTGRVFDLESNNFNLHALALSMQKAAPDAGGVGFKANLFCGADATAFTPQGKTAGELDVTQAYIETKMGALQGLSLKAGKFVTMAGAEVIESKDNWQHSRGLLFGYAIPFTHMGARATYVPNDKGSLTVGLVNGWDTNRDSNATNGNKGKTLEGSLSLTPTKGFNLALTGLYGPEQKDNNRNQRYVMDLVGCWKFLEKFTLMANWDYGSEQRAGGVVAGSNAIWTGVAGYARWDINSRWAASGRAERFSDLDGARITVGTMQKVTEWTVTGEYKPWSDFITRLEYRQDTSSKAIYAKGDRMSRIQNTVAAEWIYQF